MLNKAGIANPINVAFVGGPGALHVRDTEMPARRERVETGALTSSPTLRDLLKVVGPIISAGDRYELAEVTAYEMDTLAGRKAVAAAIEARLSANPELSAALALVRTPGASSDLYVAGRQNAGSGSKLEGVYGVIQRLCNSPLLKAKARAAGAVWYTPGHLDESGLARLRLPGDFRREELFAALAEGETPNRRELAGELLERLPTGERVVILLGGPSGAGKSTFIEELKRMAGGRNIVPFVGDMYFRDADDPGLPKTPAGTTYWDDPSAMHFEEMQRDLVTLIQTGKGDLPIYNFKDVRPGGWRIPGVQGTGFREERKNHVELGPDDIVVVDSLHATNPILTRGLDRDQVPTASLYLDSVQAEDRLVRRLVRDFSQRSREPELTLSDWDNTTFPGEVKFVRPTILELDPARDLFLTLQFPNDLGLSREEIQRKVARQKEYGIEPSFEAFRTPDEGLAEFARAEAVRFQKILSNPASTEDQKKRAAAGLERLRNAPDPVLKPTAGGDPSRGTEKILMTLADSLKKHLPEDPFVIPADTVKTMLGETGLTLEEFLTQLIPVARAHARPPISNYKVGAAGLGGSGNVYLGVNLEFPKHPLNQTVHGEQFLVTNARRNGETELSALAISAAPCGHCRQFLNELGNGDALRIFIPQHETRTLAQFLPDSFGPKDLGVEGALLSPRKNGLTLATGGLISGRAGEGTLSEAALAAADAAYAPYSKSPSGVAIQTEDGKVYTGSYLENAAFNPSLSPLQGALVALVADGKPYEAIRTAVLVEKAGAPVSQAATTHDLLATVAPRASFQVQPAV